MVEAERVCIARRKMGATVPALCVTGGSCLTSLFITRDLNAMCSTLYDPGKAFFLD